MNISNVLLLALAALFVGCASKTKQAEMTTAAPAAATTGKAPANATPAGPAPGAQAADKDQLACTRGQESRTVKIERLTPKGCKVWYSSFGTTDPVAWSTQGGAHCESVSKKIQGNLEAAGFACVGSGDTANVATATPALKSAPVKAAAAPAPAAITAPAAAATATPAQSSEPQKAKAN